MQQFLCNSIILKVPEYYATNVSSEALQSQKSAICTLSQNIQVLLDHACRIIIPQGNFKFKCLFFLLVYSQIHSYGAFTYSMFLKLYHPVLYQYLEVFTVIGKFR